MRTELEDGTLPCTEQWVGERRLDLDVDRWQHDRLPPTLALVQFQHATPQHDTCMVCFNDVEYESFEKLVLRATSLALAGAGAPCRAFAFVHANPAGMKSLLWPFEKGQSNKVPNTKPPAAALHDKLSCGRPVAIQCT